MQVKIAATTYVTSTAIHEQIPMPAELNHISYRRWWNQVVIITITINEKINDSRTARTGCYHRAVVGLAYCNSLACTMCGRCSHDGLFEGQYITKEIFRY